MSEIVEDCLRFDIANVRAAGLFDLLTPDTADVGLRVWAYAIPTRVRLAGSVALEVDLPTLRRRESPEWVCTEILGVRMPIYRSEFSWIDRVQTLELTTTPCRFGGVRRWLRCPGERCGRRVRVLYSPFAVGFLACRECHGLVYESQAMSGSRWLRRGRRG